MPPRASRVLLAALVAAILWPVVLFAAGEDLPFGGRFAAIRSIHPLLVVPWLLIGVPFLFRGRWCGFAIVFGVALLSLGLPAIARLLDGSLRPGPAVMVVLLVPPLEIVRRHRHAFDAA